ncbi:hypothetical protein KJ567_01625 [Candidatus Bipolaricaulota bacterium]|nr:hypothetical protein [Candidatus Bipolaricaulota bacterium]
MERKDGKPITDAAITMRGSYYSALFRNRVCNPARKAPYTQKPKRGGATLKFGEGKSFVLPLGAIQKEGDIEELAKKVGSVVAG